MSFLHTHSCEAIKSELDLFKTRPTQTSIESSQWIEYKPITSISEDSPIEFIVPGSGEEYIDLSPTILHLKVRLQTSKAEKIKDDTLVVPVNNFLHSLFNQVDVFLNQKPVSPPNNSYAYRAYIETLLNYSEEAKMSHLTTSLWYDDTPGHIETVLEKDVDADDTDAITLNEGAERRRSFISGGKTVDLLGHLHCDLFNQDKFLLNGVEVRVRLVRSKNSFCLINYDADDIKVQILEASLKIRKAKINPGILLAHAKALSRGTAKYELTRVEVKSFTLHTGVFGETLDNIILGQIPKRIIIGLVSNKAYNGDKKVNPFNFHHYYLNYLALLVDGVQIPSKAITPKYPHNYVEAYHTLFSGAGVFFSNEGNCISRDSYVKGQTFYVFDLTPDMSANCNTHWNLIKQGAVRLELRFDQVLTESINCIVYSEYDNILEIDSNRQIIVDFSG